MEFRNNIEIHDSIIENAIFILTFFCVFIGIVVYKNLHMRKLKKLKYEGTGMVKMTKIFNINVKYHSGKDESYYVYRLETRDDEKNIYRSKGFKDLEYGGRTLEEMRRNYGGVEYDLSNKDVVLKQINENISRLECELSTDPGFFRKRELKNELKTMEEYKKIAEEGPIVPYVIIKGHKITIGDLIDVYVDPENPKNYYFDLDFTEGIAL